jgi:RNA polymerase sigma factor (sigma-70 family)
VSESADDTDVVARFSVFYESQRRAAIRLAWLMTHDSTVAEDVVQDAFTEVFQRFAQIDNPAGYLRRSVVNGVFQRSRRAGRERRRLASFPPDTVRAEDEPSAGMIDVIARLPFKQRTAIVLRYWSDLDDRAIAEALGVRPATVRSLLSRGLATLRKEVSP